MWLKVGYKYRLSTLPSTTFMTACCVLLLLSLQLSGRADCFSVSFQGLRTNERTNDRTFTWPGFTTVSVLEREGERERAVCWSNLRKAIRQIKSIRIPAVNSVQVCVKSRSTCCCCCCLHCLSCLLYFRSTLFCFFKWWVFIDHHGSAVIDHFGCCAGKSELHCRMFVGENQGNMLYQSDIFCVFVCVCVVPELVVAIWLPVLTQSRPLNQPQVLAICAPNLRMEEGVRRPCSWMFRGLLVKVLSSDNLWTRWMGGVQWKNTPLILVGVFALL